MEVEPSEAEAESRRQSMWVNLRPLSAHPLSPHSFIPPPSQESPQYVDVLPAAGAYSCVTYVVDLKRVCNPVRSSFSYAPLAAANGGCTCLPVGWSREDRGLGTHRQGLGR